MNIDELLAEADRAALPDPHDEREVMCAPLLRKLAAAIRQLRGSGEPTGWISQHDLVGLLQGFPQQISLLESNKRNVPLYTHPQPALGVVVPEADIKAFDDFMFEFWHRTTLYPCDPKLVDAYNTAFAALNKYKAMLASRPSQGAQNAAGDKS